MSINGVGNSGTSAGEFGSFDLHKMTIKQVRAATTELCAEGKLDPMQQALANISGWLELGSDGTLGHGSTYSSSGIAAESSFAETYDMVSTLQDAAAFEQAHGNYTGASEYVKMLSAFEDLASKTQGPKVG